MTLFNSWLYKCRYFQIEPSFAHCRGHPVSRRFLENSSLDDVPHAFERCTWYVVDLIFQWYYTSKFIQVVVGVDNFNVFVPGEVSLRKLLILDSLTVLSAIKGH